MSEIMEIEQTKDNWKMVTLLIGGVVGALIGLGGAYLLVQRAESENEKVQVTAGDGLKLGLTVLTLLRQIAQLGEGR